MKKLRFLTKTLATTFLFQANALGYIYRFNCLTDTNKIVEISYFRAGGVPGRVSRVIIDGIDYTERAELEFYSSTFRVEVYIANFRKYDRLRMSVKSGDSSYLIGYGAKRSMNCTEIIPKEPESQGI